MADELIYWFPSTMYILISKCAAYTVIFIEKYIIRIKQKYPPMRSLFPKYFSDVFLSRFMRGRGWGAYLYFFVFSAKVELTKLPSLEKEYFIEKKDSVRKTSIDCKNALIGDFSLEHQLA